MNYTEFLSRLTPSQQREVEHLAHNKSFNYMVTTKISETVAAGGAIHFEIPALKDHDLESDALYIYCSELNDLDLLSQFMDAAVEQLKQRESHHARLKQWEAKNSFPNLTS